MKKELLALSLLLASVATPTQAHIRDFTPIAAMAAIPSAIGAYMALKGNDNGVALAFAGSAAAAIIGATQFNKSFTGSAAASGLTLFGFLLTAKLCKRFMEDFKLSNKHHHHSHKPHHLFPYH